MNCHSAEAAPLCSDAALYIYYRVPRSRAQALVMAFGRLTQDEHGEGATSPAPQLMKQPAGEAGQMHDTWMEIWPNPMQRFGSLAHAIQQIEERAARHGMSALIDGSRHHEYFESVPLPRGA